MMQEKELISQLKQLRDVKPSKDWVSFNKKELFKGEETNILFFPSLKLAFAGFFVFFLMLGGISYGLVKNSIPGDVLYSIRKVAHIGEAIFVSDEEKSTFQLKLANDRLEDLATAPAKNLAPTMYEFEANISEAVRNLGSFKISTSSPESIERLIKETKKLEDNKNRIEALGVVLSEKETSEWDEAFKRIVGNLIEDLEDRQMIDETSEILIQMKGLFEEGEYSEALELYLTNQ
ncbi:MAG: hypothetical protein ABIA08_02635 [bacterium]